MYTCMILCCTQDQQFGKLMIQSQASSSGKMREIIHHDPHSALWVFYSRWVNISCTFVMVIPLEIAVPSNSALFKGTAGNFRHSQGVQGNLITAGRCVGAGQIPWFWLSEWVYWCHHRSSLIYSHPKQLFFFYIYIFLNIWNSPSMSIFI